MKDDDLWILAIDPGIKSLGYAFYNTSGKWGPCSILSAKDLIGIGRAWGPVIKHLPRTRIRFIDVLIYENLPIINKKVALLLQATVGISIGVWCADGRLHKNALIDSVTPQEWAKFAGVSSLRGDERKTGAYEFAKTLVPALAVKDGADAIVIAAYAAQKLLAD